jgi:hypothetical protein
VLVYGYRDFPKPSVQGFPKTVDPTDRSLRYLLQPPTVPSMTQLHGNQRPPRGGRGRCRRACERTPLRGRRRCATLRQFPTDASALLTDLSEARPLILTELNVKTPGGGQLIYGLVDCAATLDFGLEYFIRRLSLKTHKSKVKTSIRLANGQRDSCEINFELIRHEFKRTFKSFSPATFVSTPLTATPLTPPT